MSKKKVLFISFILFSFFFVEANAQTEKDSIPLIQILQEVTDRFGYRFSYADRTVEDIVTLRPPETATFHEAIDFLEEKTDLVFKVLLANTLVAIQKKKESQSSKKIASVEKLEEVVLTNYLAKGITKKTNGVFEINYKNFGILPGLIEPDALQTLQALPGVESVNETISEINIRGGTNDQNLILWDGIRMYQSGHFFGLISAFNPYQTKKVSLYKNGTNPAFGNSVSGVIAMQTEEKVNDSLYAEAGLNYISGHGFVDTPINGKSSIQLSARASYSNVFKTPTYNQYYERAFQDTEITSENNEVIRNNEKFSFYDLSLRWLSNLSDRDKIRVNFINIANNLEFTENAVIDETVASRESTLDQNSLGIGLLYDRKWSKKFNTSVQYYLSNYQLNAKNANILDQEELIQENDVLEHSLKLNSRLTINDKINWQNGYEYIETHVDDIENNSDTNSESIPQSSVRNHAIFSAIHYSSTNNRTNIEAGGRLNYFPNFDLVLAEPRFSFNQRFLDYFTLEVLGEFKSQTTTQVIDFQNDFLGIEKRKWQLANQDDIPVLKSKQLSFGLHYYKNKWLVAAETYAKEVTGITSQSQGFQNQHQYARVTGSYLVKGIDLLINKKLNQFSLWASYSLTDNEYTFTDFLYPNFPNNVEIVNSLSAAASYSVNKFKVSAGVNWRNGKPFTPLTPEGIANNLLEYEPANSSNLKDYLRVDVSASQEFKIHPKINAHAGISVWNLLDSDNIINTYYEQRNGQVTRVEQFALGLTPNFIFRLFF